jgi:hypothetical protein
LPFGGQPINDHRYLLGCIGAAFGDEELACRFSGDRAECAWLLGVDATRKLAALPKPTEAPRSVLFREGGYAVLRNGRDHVFIDCGPVGAAGRGWHGHNDVLSFEAFLDGHLLVVDCGTYVYSADYEARNAFRSTAYHNTPKVDGEEVNRLGQDLFSLHDDARPEIRGFESGPSTATLSVAHSGYERLSEPVKVLRRITLHHDTHGLTIEDSFEGAGSHAVELPLHLDSEVQVESERTVVANGRRFTIDQGAGPEWKLTIEPARVSSNYGVAAPSRRLVWRHEGKLQASTLRIGPC